MGKGLDEGDHPQCYVPAVPSKNLRYSKDLTPSNMQLLAVSVMGIE